MALNDRLSHVNKALKLSLITARIGEGRCLAGETPGREKNCSGNSKKQVKLNLKN